MTEHERRLDNSHWVRYFGNLSDIDDRVRNISWQTLNLMQSLVYNDAACIAKSSILWT